MRRLCLLLNAHAGPPLFLSPPSLALPLPAEGLFLCLPLCYPPRMSTLDDIIREVLSDPVSAHCYFFAHRHSDTSPEYFEEVILDIYDFDRPKVLELIFRGGAKSTILEEATVLLSCLQIIKNGIIIGESETRAAERLTSIKYELETNDKLLDTFGPMRSEPWTNTRALLASNTYLQAYGRGQSLRGAKYLDQRPNFAFLDDIESEESTNTPEAIYKTMRWVTATLYPAMAKESFIRMAATPLNPNAACVQLSKDSSFLTHKIPVYHYRNDQLISSWPARFPLGTILKKQEEYERLGMAREFAQEYLCEAEHSETKAFDVTTIQVQEQSHTYEPTILIVDPARSTKASSSLTGYVVASFANARITIWEAFGSTHRPSDIIATIFELSQRYNPTFIGVERDGLEEFIFQPLRAAMVERSVFLPIQPIKAPKNKLEFIRSLQPFISSGDIVSAKHHPQLVAQLQNFPAGKIDTLNALAYVPRLYPGEPVYKGFNPKAHLIRSPLEEMRPHASVLYAVNATSTEAAVAAVAAHRSRLVILGDAVIEGAPASAVPEALAALRAQIARQGSLIIPRPLQTYDTLGLKAILRAQGETPSIGAAPDRARASLQSQLDTAKLAVSEDAKWTLRALTSGYTYEPQTKEPKRNSYATLMGAIEAALPVFMSQNENLQGHYTIDPRSGVRHLTSRPNRYG
jgi:hypothetical protein